MADTVAPLLRDVDANDLSSMQSSIAPIFSMDGSHESTSNHSEFKQEKYSIHIGSCNKRGMAGYFVMRFLLLGNGTQKSKNITPRRIDSEQSRHFMSTMMMMPIR
jgi:hypothetical protein